VAPTCAAWPEETSRSTIPPANGATSGTSADDTLGTSVFRWKIPIQPSSAATWWTGAGTPSRLDERY